MKKDLWIVLGQNKSSFGDWETRSTFMPYENAYNYAIKLVEEDPKRKFILAACQKVLACETTVVEKEFE